MVIFFLQKIVGSEEGKPKFVLSVYIVKEQSVFVLVSLIWFHHGYLGTFSSKLSRRDFSIIRVSTFR